MDVDAYTGTRRAPHGVAELPRGRELSGDALGRSFADGRRR
jgi:hypothetical protein